MICAVSVNRKGCIHESEFRGVAASLIASFVRRMAKTFQALFAIAELRNEFFHLSSTGDRPG
jgi:hypothetical protein